MKSTLLIPVRANISKPETGYDTAIMRVDEGTDTTGPEFSLLLFGVSQEQAERLGVGLRVAEWTMTDDPAVVETKGLVHDCPTCRAGVDQALAHMKHHPGTVMAVGLLRWCSP